MTIQETLDYYKQNITKCWKDEKYKWEAVKHFRDNWDIDAIDFAGMLEEALSYSKNLLSGGMYYAGTAICSFAKINPEKMRELFRLLYNEQLPLAQRLQPFKDGCEELIEEYRNADPNNSKAMNHYQDLRALCVYLSFAYPEKYFLFKYKMYVGYKKLVDYQETSLEKDSDMKKYDNFERLCKAVVDAIEQDEELKNLQKSQIDGDEECYADPAYHLLAQTIIYVNAGREDDESKVISTVVDNDVNKRKYWIYSPGEGASIWDDCYTNGSMAIGWSEIGDLRAYNTKDEMKEALKKMLIQLVHLW